MEQFLVDEKLPIPLAWLGMVIIGILIYFFPIARLLDRA
jgi:hypothetical protein